VHVQTLEISERGEVRKCGFWDVSNQWGVRLQLDEAKGTDMSGNPLRTGFDSGAPFLHGPPLREDNGGEEVVLAAIDPGGGHQRSGSEELATSHIKLIHRGQLVNDKVPNLLWNVHRAWCRIVVICLTGGDIGDMYKQRF